MIKKNKITMIDSTVYIFGNIGDEDISVKDITHRIELLDPKTDTLKIKINSPGGLLYDGIALAAAVKNYEGKSICSTVGMCGSAATLISMAADESEIIEEGVFFIHYPQQYTEGDFNELFEAATELKKVAGVIVDHYLKKFNESKEELTKLLENGGTSLNAKEAVKYGLVDRIISIENKLTLNNDGSHIKMSDETKIETLEETLNDVEEKKLEGEEVETEEELKARLKAEILKELADEAEAAAKEAAAKEEEEKKEEEEMEMKADKAALKMIVKNNDEPEITLNEISNMSITNQVDNHALKMEAQIKMNISGKVEQGVTHTSLLDTAKQMLLTRGKNASELAMAGSKEIMMEAVKTTDISNLIAGACQGTYDAYYMEEDRSYESFCRIRRISSMAPIKANPMTVNSALAVVPELAPFPKHATAIQDGPESLVVPKKMGEILEVSWEAFTDLSATHVLQDALFELAQSTVAAERNDAILALASGTNIATAAALSNDSLGEMIQMMRRYNPSVLVTADDKYMAASALLFPQSNVNDSEMRGRLSLTTNDSLTTEYYVAAANAVTLYRWAGFGQSGVEVTKNDVSGQGFNFTNDAIAWRVKFVTASHLTRNDLVVSNAGQ